MAKGEGGGNRRVRTHHTPGRLSACLYPALPGIFSAVATGPAVVFDRQGNNNPFPHRSTTVTACLAAFPFWSVRGRRIILLPVPAAGIGDIANIDFHSFYPLQKFMPTHGELASPFLSYRTDGLYSVMFIVKKNGIFKVCRVCIMIKTSLPRHLSLIKNQQHPLLAAKPASFSHFWII